MTPPIEPTQSAEEFWKGVRVGMVITVPPEGIPELFALADGTLARGPDATEVKTVRVTKIDKHSITVEPV